VIGGYLYFYYHANQTRDIVKRACFYSTLLSKKGKSIEITEILLVVSASKVFVRLLHRGWRQRFREEHGGGSVLRARKRRIHGVGGLNPFERNIFRKLEAAAKHDT
jgi:hypothetical protein